MKKSKRMTAAILTMVMALGLTACGQAAGPGTGADAAAERGKAEAVQVQEDSSIGNGHEAENAKEAENTGAEEVTPDLCEANGHTWEEATCAQAKTCSVCGETEGEALDHAWVDATYTAPKTCSVCGAAEGERLLAYFEECGLIDRLADRSVVSPIELGSPRDENLRATGKVTVENYETIKADEVHEEMDGYEWKVMTLRMDLEDEIVYTDGVDYTIYWECNFYEDREGDSSHVDESDLEAGIPLDVYWNGETYADGCLMVNRELSDWTVNEEGVHCISLTMKVSVRVPEGFDGFIFCIESTDRYDHQPLMHDTVTDNTLLYRFD